MRFSFILSLLLLVSCATTMPGQEVGTGSNDISVTIKRDPVYSNDVIQMYQLALKNNTDSWMELPGSTLTGGDEVEVLVGERIESWLEACLIEKNVNDYNTALVLGAVAVGGATVAGVSQHQPTASTGAIVALGSISILAVKDYQKAKNKVDFQRAFPEKHVFQKTMIPPKKVVQRWILVENRKKESFTLTLAPGVGVTVDGSKSY